MSSSNSTAALLYPDVVLAAPKTTRGVLSPRQAGTTNETALSARQTVTVDGKGLPRHPGAVVEQSATVERVEAAVKQISEFIQGLQRDLVFSIDDSSDRLVVKIVDSRTHEVIRQIPSEEMLRIAKQLDSNDSLILNERA